MHTVLTIIIIYVILYFVSIALFEMFRIENNLKSFFDLDIDNAQPYYNDGFILLMMFIFWWLIWIVVFFEDLIPWFIKKLTILFTFIYYTFFKKVDK